MFLVGDVGQENDTEDPALFRRFSSRRKFPGFGDVGFPLVGVKGDNPLARVDFRE